METKTISSLLIGVGFGLASAFFCFYTARLLYINLTGAVGVRNSGMFVGALVFPIVTVACALISWKCLRLTRK